VGQGSGNLRTDYAGAITNRPEKFLAMVAQYVIADQIAQLPLSTEPRDGSAFRIDEQDVVQQTLSSAQ
jgi:hypothetical protein